MKVPRFVTHGKDGERRDPKDVAIAAGQKVADWIKAKAKDRRLLAQLLTAATLTATTVTGGILAANHIKDLDHRVTRVEHRPVVDTRPLEKATAEMAARVEALRKRAGRLATEVSALLSAPTPSPTGNPSPQVVGASQKRVQALAESVSATASDLATLTGRLQQTAEDASATDRATAEQAQALSDLADATRENASALAATITAAADKESADVAGLASDLSATAASVDTLAGKVSDLVASIAANTDDIAALKALTELVRSLVPASTFFVGSGTATYSPSGPAVIPLGLFIRDGPSTQHIVTFTADLGGAGCSAALVMAGIAASNRPVIQGPGYGSASAVVSLGPGQRGVTIQVFAVAGTPCTYSNISVTAQRIYKGTD